MMSRIHISFITATLILIVTGCSLFEKSSSNEKQNDPVVVTVDEPDSSPTDDLEVGTSKGDLAPDIELPDPEGNTKSLSDLKGKVVLVDFWASWCAPCRRAHPELVSLYKKYNNAEFKKASGFEIFSVSLDRDKSSWKKAIKADELAWDYHVSDLKYWDSKAARKYGIRSIPFNLVIDHRGVIIGKNLRGTLLHKTIDEHVENL